MRIWHISDTHCLHEGLIIPEGIDIIIHSGDCSNSKEWWKNKEEVTFFLDWFEKIPVKNKVLVGGNHDTSIEKKKIRLGDFLDRGITYLENSSTIIEGLNIWGSPITPLFGENWAWNRGRDKMERVWKVIPESIDIVISHGPPKGILDLTINHDNKLELCGCLSLKKHMIKIQPKLCLFGHIHNHKYITNAGTMKIYGCKTLFSNATCVEDGKLDKGITSHGNIIEI